MRAHERRPGIWATWGGALNDARRMVRHGGGHLIGIMLLFHIAILVIALPVINWLFHEALRAGGMIALDFGSLQLNAGLTVTFALLMVIGLIAFWIASVQFAVLIIALHRVRLGLPLSTRQLLRDLGEVLRKLLRASSLPLVAYLFLLLPLTGFGFASVLAQGISVPPFISGELMKEQTTAVAWIVFMLLLGLLNIRLALALPIFMLTDATGGKSLRLSWRLTRGRTAIPLVGAVFTLLLLAGVATFALIVTAVIPTAITDQLAPDASPLVAAFSLGIAQLLGLLLTAIVTALIVGVLVSLTVRGAHRLPAELPLKEPARGAADAKLGRRGIAGVLVGACIVIALGLGVAAIPTMNRLADHPDTIVLAHRGFTAGGVENTICGLEAAAEAGAELVEMDVLQTKDSRFVVMHDPTLSRLAGIDRRVKDLTLDELTRITVRDGAGHECAIPSLADYVTRAAELGMPLLIEIKLGGLDTADHVALLVAELEALDALESNIYHSLDARSVAELKTLRPSLTVGYIMPFAAGGAPDTPADFIVVEEWSATPVMQRAAADAGLGFVVWTVNETNGIREHLRRDTEGIITDRPDLALTAREEMDQQSGLADTLVDALTRFVVVF